MQYRYVDSVHTDLEGGRPIAPGEFTGEIDVSEFITSVDEETQEETKTPNKNYQLLQEGRLIAVEPVKELAGKDLDARAKELNIEGRTAMSADELRSAISEAEAGAGKEGEEK